MIGDPGNLFNPDALMNRAQITTVLYRMEDEPATVSAADDLESFPDSEKVSAFAEKEMKWAVGAGLTQGDNGLLNPQGTTSRAVGATIIHRFTENYSEK